MISDDKRLLASFGAQGGVLVEDLVADGPADEAGFQSGDVVTAIDGEPLDNAKALRRRVARTDPGQSMQLSVLRDGRRGTLDVTLGQQPVESPRSQQRLQSPGPESDATAADPLGKLGFEQLQSMSAEIARQYRLEPSWGVLVLQLRRFSAADMAGLKRGNIITRAEGQKVTGVDELRKAIEDKDLTEGVRMRVRTPGGPARYVLLSLES
jgi:serine protease Do